MNLDLLVREIKQKNTFLCVGLDTDLAKMPSFLQGDIQNIIEFNKQIIQATLPHCVAFKVNTAFYESLGWQGWKILEETFQLIPDTHFKIADAKRADIGNTSEQYAKAFFERMNVDAVTVSPYMGLDCLEPFFKYSNKMTIVLGLTSNSGSQDFEMLQTNKGYLFEEVINKIASKYSHEKAMFVVGATQSLQIDEIRKIIPKHFLLVPGIGAQGGSLKDTILKGKNDIGGLLINSSRSIIYASSGIDYAEAAGVEAEKTTKEMQYWFI